MAHGSARTTQDIDILDSRKDLLVCRFAVLDLPALIHTKRAAGRPKDLEAIAELEMLLQRREIQ